MINHIAVVLPTIVVLLTIIGNVTAISQTIGYLDTLIPENQD